jgi:AraC-like DNA-binding protein
MRTVEGYTLFFEGAASALLLLSAAALARPGPGAHPRLWGGAFAFSVVAYILWNSPPLLKALGPLGGLVWFLSSISTGLFLLFGRALLIAPRPPDRMALAVLAVFTTLALLGAFAPPPTRPVFWMIHQALEFACYGYVLVVALVGWPDDLDEGRRRLRGPLVLVITVYGLAQGVFETWTFVAVRPAIYAFWEAVALTVVGFATPMAILQTRWDRIVPAPQAAGSPPEGRTDSLSPADRIELATVLAIVDEAKAYRAPDLTIGALAERARVPEHRLRRLINQGLGFRNYTAFLNTRRLAEAKGLLADPAQARTPILTLALDLGYGSVGPFNRAFKDDTGLTPTEWRNRALRSASPISE